MIKELFYCTTIFLAFISCLGAIDYEFIHGGVKDTTMIFFLLTLILMFLKLREN